MWDWIYVVGVIITAFFCWKKWENKIKMSESKIDDSFFGLLSIPEFNLLLIISMMWVIAVPAVLFWKILDVLYNRFKPEK